MNDFLSVSQYSYNLNIRNIAWCAYDYSTSLYSDRRFNELDIPFPSTLSKAVTKRKAEYLAGRFAAREALKKLGIIKYNIDTGKNRAPMWPKGIVASITHTDKTAICIAARDQHFEYLGVDLENILASDMAQNLKGLIIDENEEQLLVKASSDFPTLFTLAFSAKESVFKALHPYVQNHFDFRAAKISDISLNTQNIKLSLTEHLCDTLPKGTVVGGDFCISNKQVISCIYKAA